MKADLHIHTTASDGRYDPLKVVSEAAAAHLKYVAITDHDTIDGLLAIKKSGIFKKTELNEFKAPSGLSIIPGAEFNADFPGYEVHILGYFIDIENAELEKQLDLFKENRLKRLTMMIEKINSLGYRIEYEQVIEIAGSSAAVGRPHVARALVEKGYFKKIGEAFCTVLSKNSRAYVSQYKLPLGKIIKIIKDAGGLAVLAHPGLIGKDDLVNSIVAIPGISGIEVFHPTHDHEAVKKYLTLAEKYSLKVTGGSDFHGVTGRFPEKLGIFSIPAGLADDLRSALG